MVYRHTKGQTDYSLFSPGGVFYSLPGHPAFPVRLASEIFQECARFLTAAGNPGPYHLYDPCCGGAYHLSVLAYLHPEAFHTISASDIAPEAVELARRNLSLLTLAGLAQRRTHIEQMLEQFDKASHRETLAQVNELKNRLEHSAALPAIRVFQADALAPGELGRQLQDKLPELVITDIPYGDKSSWVENPPSAGDQTPLWRMLDSLHAVLVRGAVVAVAADKAQKIAHPGFQQLRRLKIGHRQVAILKPI